MASVVCKNLIANVGSDPKYTDLWIQFDAQFKKFIKDAIMNTLACPSNVVRGQIASLVAAIATIEIPRQEWPELIPGLC